MAPNGRLATSGVGPHKPRFHAIRGVVSRILPMESKYTRCKARETRYNSGWTGGEMEFAERLRNLRETKGLTQSDLAERAGMSSHVALRNGCPAAAP